MLRLKKIVSNLLIVFVVFSLGFAVGKEFTRNDSTISTVSEGQEDHKVVVYYLRSTFRCWQCNMIEVYTDELIKSEYSDEVASGLLEWLTIDYLQDRELAIRYNISGNTIVVAQFKEGQELDHTRLDRVMEMVFDKDSFNDYVRETIDKHLLVNSLSLSTVSQRGI